MADNDQRFRLGTYTQKSWTLHKGSFISLHNQPCKVSKVDEFPAHPKKRLIKIDFRANNIFNRTEIRHLARSDADCNVQVPYVNHTHYKIEAISQDGLLTLVTENGLPRDGPDLRLPPTPPGVTDDLLTRTRNKLREGNYLVVEVVSSMGTEELISVKDVLAFRPN